MLLKLSNHRPDASNAMTTYSSQMATLKRMETFGELEHVRHVLAQARIGQLVAAETVQRSVEAIEAAWCALGRTKVIRAWQALTFLERGELPDTQRCIAAVKELSTLIDSDPDYDRFRNHAPVKNNAHNDRQYD
jgi:hypothetical protein